VPVAEWDTVIVEPAAAASLRSRLGPPRHAGTLPALNRSAAVISLVSGAAAAADLGSVMATLVVRGLDLLSKG
jgi:hypothetical protein